MSSSKSSQHWSPSDLTPKNSSPMMSLLIPVDSTSHGINPATVSAHTDLETHIYTGHTCHEPPRRCNGDCRFALSYFYDLLISRCSGRNSSPGLCFSGTGVVILSGGEMTRQRTCRSAVNVLAKYLAEVAGRGPGLVGAGSMKWWHVYSSRGNLCKLTGF